MKSKQFCSVCKEWLEMEVVPTGDGEDDDGVVWYRCPQCQGFLPKLKGSDPAAAGSDASVTEEENGPAEETASDPGGDGGSAGQEAEPAPDLDEDLPWDSPADMMASQAAEEEDAPVDPDDVMLGGTDPEADALGGPTAEAPEAGEAGEDEPSEPAEPGEPLAEYRTMLDDADQGDPRPYRPWDTYEVGDCLVHLAWDDCGVVVAKEDLPGGRKVIKCYFGEAGVVRLIEKAPR